MQIFRSGIKKSILDKIVPHCINNGYSEVSSKALFDAYDEQRNLGGMAMAILDAAVISDLRVPLCKA